MYGYIFLDFKSLEQEIKPNEKAINVKELVKTIREFSKKRELLISGIQAYIDNYDLSNQLYDMGIEIKPTNTYEFLLDVTECMHKYKELNTFILVTSDPYIKYILKYLRKYGKRIILITFESSLQIIDKDYVDEYLILDEIPDLLLNNI